MHTFAALLSAAAAIDTNPPVCKLAAASIADPVCKMDCRMLLLPKPLWCC